MRIELVVDVLERRAGHVVTKDARVDAVRHRAQLLDVLALQRFDIALDVPHLVEVQAGVVLATVQRGDDTLGRRL